MFYCEQFSRIITDPTLVFWVEQPLHGSANKCFVGKDMVDKEVPDVNDRTPRLLSPGEGGVNFYAVSIDGVGEAVRGDFQFSLGFHLLRQRLPGVYTKYYVWQ